MEHRGFNNKPSLTGPVYMMGFDNGVFCLTKNEEPIEWLDLNEYSSSVDKFNAGQDFYKRCLKHNVDIMDNKEVTRALFADIGKK